ncbi:hypothetical protein FV242_18860 [Methylobacterium sp. WL64]|uniref:hypothetical protein n=1 Tax=Methylobacterium sp. WL64 TaxID=2603894 RepID=UPI0011C81758|nr:hypothetical protein [Methylobacterium sp. WL64]TXN01367.1 hypothetical protein FV242_18860 [Methylobacterium sp. WL64]
MMETTANESLAHQGTERLREAITAAAAIGFLAGGGIRVIADLGTVQTLLTAVLYLPLGAMAAAVLAGVAMNLIALPVLGTVLTQRRLPALAYQAAGALSGVAAFAGAFVQFAPGVA